MRKLVFPSIFILLSACAWVSAGTAAILEQSPKTLSVVGVGDVKMTPNVAHISFTIETENKEPGEAVNQNDGQSQRMLGALTRFQIGSADVKTTNYSIYPYTKRDPNDYNRVLGTWYRVTHDLKVTLRDISLLGDLVSEVAALDAEINFRVSLDVGDKSSAYASALADAVADARNKAVIMAAAEGMTVGGVHSMNSNLSEVVPSGGDSREAMTDVAIAPGQTSIGVRVNVVFELN